MKLLIAILVTINFAFAKNITIDDAPLEWLIASTLSEKSNSENVNLEEDELIQKIFNTIEYNADLDEIILISSFRTESLRQDLLTFLKTNSRRNKVDPMYTDWKRQSKLRSMNEVTLTKVKTRTPLKGFYYFNHIHTNISKDNEKLKFLKISPEKTFKYINNFLKKRKQHAVAAFTDHDTDRAFDKVTHLNNDRLNILRGIEWGGKTHMGLIDIKPNWDLLSRGREFEKEESIIMSRSSEGFRIVNHPNRKSEFPYTSWLDADGVEVWNTILEGAPLTRLNIRRSNNRKAFAQWSNSLKDNKKYTAVAGSDFHFTIPCLRDRSLHYPANFIPMEDKSNAKQYLTQGNVSILTRPTAPKLALTVKPVASDRAFMMGDRVFGLNTNVKIELYGDFSDTNKGMGSVCYKTIDTFYKLLTFWKKRRWEIRFYNKAGDVIAKKLINPKKFSYKKHFRAEFNYKPKQSDLVRAELWEVNKKAKSIDLLGSTNPIYFN